MEYRPNIAAQMLTTSRSNTLELIIVDVVYGGRLADSTKNMAHTAKKAGYSLLISETNEDGLGAALESAASRLVDGVVMYAPRLHIEDDIFPRRPTVPTGGWQLRSTEFRSPSLIALPRGQAS